MISQIAPMLSKSRFIAGLQCQLRLWHQCYNPKLAKAPSPVQQALFEAGHEVGRLATELYPNGVRIKENYLHHRQAEQSTRKALGDKSFQAIFEAAFTFDGTRIRVDILERLENDLWNLVEVKSSTSVKDVYKPDVGVQYYILKGLGFKISSAGILHINNEYVYDGRQMNLGRLFYFSDLTEEVVNSQKEIAYQVSELKNVLVGQYPPNIHPSRHCFNSNSLAGDFKSERPGRTGYLKKYRFMRIEQTYLIETGAGKGIWSKTIFLRIGFIYLKIS